MCRINSPLDATGNGGNNLDSDCTRHGAQRKTLTRTRAKRMPDPQQRDLGTPNTHHFKKHKGPRMYVKIVDSLNARILMEGSTDHPPDTWDYISIDGVEYLVVQRVSRMEETIQGPFQDDQVLTHAMIIYVEEPSEKEL